MRTYCVVNTVADASWAATTLSTGKMPYSQRSWLLKAVILPQLVEQFPGSLYVVGVFDDLGVGYRTIHYEPLAHDCTGALELRQAAVEYISPHAEDVVIFLHDDHVLDPSFAARLSLLERFGVNGKRWDVLSPARRTRARTSAGEPLNSGADSSYVNGHCSVMRVRALTAVPWSTVARVFTWDVDHTQRLRKAQMSLAWVGDLVVWDLEFGSRPWE